MVISIDTLIYFHSLGTSGATWTKRWNRITRQISEYLSCWIKINNIFCNFTFSENHFWKSNNYLHKRTKGLGLGNDLGLVASNYA